MLKSVIGLEVHVELNTESKMFSSGRNSYNRHPNENVNVVDLGLPGVLPTVNTEGVRKAIKLALALNCDIASELIFDRKNYYYPDLPKGYQITQMYKPIGTNGYLDINVMGEEKKVTIHDIHIEEDSASLDHTDNYSLLDYNRAGVPLIEIVTDPVFENENDVIAFLEDLRNILLYLNVSDASSSKGQIRCDVNISVKEEDSKILGTRTEMKNINSFATVKDSIKCEVTRQIKAINNNEEIEQETRRYDALNNKTYSMRKKVDAIDYKYYVEPNIPVIKISEDYVNAIKKEIVMLPNEKRRKYINEYNLTLKEANIFIKDMDLSTYFEKCLEYDVNPKLVCNWICSNIVSYITSENININEFYYNPKMLSDLLKLVSDNKISNNQAKEIFIKCVDLKKEPLVIVKEDNYVQILDEKQIINTINEILDNNKKEVEEYIKGKTGLFGYFVGLVLKESKGKYNPALVSKILKSEIERRG